jgi:integrase
MARVEPLPGVRYRSDRQCWEAQFVLTYKADGSPDRRITKRFMLLEDANDWKREHDKKRRRGEISEEMTLTIGVWASEWLEGKRRAKRAELTILKYETYIDKFIKPLLGNKRISDVRPLAVKRFLDQVGDKTKPGEVFKTKLILSMMLEDAARVEIIPRNPCAGIRVELPAAPVKTRWSREEAAKVIRACLDPACTSRVRFYVTVALMTALRREELLGLRWSDVDFENGSIHIRQVVIFAKGKWRIQPQPKNPESERPIYLDAVTMKLLEHQKLLVEKWREMKEDPRAEDDWQEHDLVFPSSRGTPFAEGRLRQAFNALCVAAKVPQIRLYDTRATYNSVTGLELRLPPKLIADRMGHKNEQTQQQFYQRVNDTDRKTLALSPLELYGLELESDAPDKHVPVSPLYSQPTAMSFDFALPTKITLS